MTVTVMAPVMMTVTVTSHDYNIKSTRSSVAFQVTFTYLRKCLMIFLGVRWPWRRFQRHSKQVPVANPSTSLRLCGV